VERNYALAHGRYIAHNLPRRVRPAYEPAEEMEAADRGDGGEIK
jgi:hypothetical protein